MRDAARLAKVVQVESLSLERARLHVRVRANLDEGQRARLVEHFDGLGYELALVNAENSSSNLPPFKLNGQIPIIGPDGEIVQTLAEEECRAAVRLIPATPYVSMTLTYFADKAMVSRRERFPKVRIRPGLNQHNHSIFVIRARELKIERAWYPGVIEVDGAEYWISTWRNPTDPESVWYWTTTGDGMGVLL